MNMMRKITPMMILLGLMLLPMGSSALDPDDILSADEAFMTSHTVEGDTIVLQFDVAKDYYLYRHAFSFSSDTLSLDDTNINIPAGKKKTDEFFGEVETYRGKVNITIPVLDGQSGQLTYRYQGCADAGICYPPKSKTIDIEMPTGAQSSNAMILGQGNNQGDLLGTSSNTGFFNGVQEVLPESQAFLVEAIAMDANMLSVRVTMRPNIYLYQDQFEVSSLTKGISIGAIDFPKAELKDDPHFGEVNVFWAQVEIPVNIERSVPELNTMDLRIDFQGCVDEGICYPPAFRLITVDLPEYVAGASNSSRSNMNANDSNQVSSDVNLSEQQLLTQQISDSAWWLVVLQFFGFGLLLSLTPCVFPMIPILSGLIVGQKNISTSRAFTLSLVYVLAMALTYTAVGVIAGSLGANLQAIFQKPWIVITFCGVFVILAISMFGFFELQLPSRWQNKLSGISNRQKAGSLWGVAIMGLLSALIVGPCVTPPLAAAVIYISTNANGPVVGGLALFAMAMGMGMILLAVGTSAGKWVPKSGGWMNVVKSLFGILLLAMAIWFLDRILDPTLVLFLWGLLSLISGVMWYQHAVANGITGWLKWLIESIKVLLVTIGLIYIIAALGGNSNPFRPLEGLFSASAGGVVKVEKVDFKKISSLDELNQTIKSSNKPIMLDFYADWCVECKRMEATTFKDSDLIAVSKDFLMLKADVTAQNEADQELMAAFAIIGPPATLFWNQGGQPLTRYNFFGYRSAEELIQTFENILK